MCGTLVAETELPIHGVWQFWHTFGYLISFENMEQKDQLVSLIARSRKTPVSDSSRKRSTS